MHTSELELVSDTLTPETLLVLQPTTASEATPMNKQNFATQIIIAIIAVFIRKPSVQAHLSSATSLFDGVIKKIEKSLDKLNGEINTHQDQIKVLKDQVASERILADQKYDATAKLRTLHAKVTDITG